jgi:hypothetical protein
MIAYNDSLLDRYTRRPVDIRSLPSHACATLFLGSHSQYVMILTEAMSRLCYQWQNVVDRLPLKDDPHSFLDVFRPHRYTKSDNCDMCNLVWLQYPDALQHDSIGLVARQAYTSRLPRGLKYRVQYMLSSRTISHEPVTLHMFPEGT